ncbi:hypothetical protein [Pedobacter cryoconitis]|uniref:Uncharacterized protein n=1 Tax=Pedobacter cryoconitis TaxID=188932 RepID=A0A327T3Q0_9SPHI|nr:hypothetical protein [Pedobacter cryoconitis]RAJ35741.1 hypothetical protein LY11_00988 [Pedobacter cryoconitis]
MKSFNAVTSIKDLRKLSTFRLNPIDIAVLDVLSKGMTFNYLNELFADSVRSKDLLYR